MPTLFSKLQYKGIDRILVVDAPDEVRSLLAELGDDVRIDTRLGAHSQYEFALIFVRSSDEIAKRAAPVVGRMASDGVLWFAYPKKSSKKYQTDLSRDGGWQPLGDIDYEPVSQIAIDADWSALRFKHVQKIKSLTRSFAMSKEGKARTKK